MATVIKTVSIPVEMNDKLKELHISPTHCFKVGFMRLSKVEQDEEKNLIRSLQDDLRAKEHRIEKLVRMLESTHQRVYELEELTAKNKSLKGFIQ